MKVDLHETFYAVSRLAAKRALEAFARKWKRIYPDAVRCVEKDLDAIVAFVQFPEDSRSGPRTLSSV